MIMNNLTIWVDADALPRALRDILLRVVDQYPLNMVFIANQQVNIHTSQRVKFIQVAQGFDQADQEIVNRVQAEDIVICDDIPLAAQVIERGAVVIRFRGDLLDKHNIKGRLHSRDYMAVLRESGVLDDIKNRAWSDKDKRLFSDSLQQTIQKQIKKTTI